MFPEYRTLWYELYVVILLGQASWQHIFLVFYSFENLDFSSHLENIQIEYIELQVRRILVEQFFCCSTWKHCVTMFWLPPCLLIKNPIICIFSSIIKSCFSLAAFKIFVCLFLVSEGFSMICLNVSFLSVLSGICLAS